jgi:hypothetical protein
MDLQKTTDTVYQPWSLDLTIDDVLADLDPGTLVWRERESARRS